MNYYQVTNYVSNSDLSSMLDEELNREKPENIQTHYDFGNLVDIMLTEPDKLKSFVVEKGISCGDEELARLMVEELRKDELIEIFLRRMRGQYEFYRTIQIPTLIGFKAKCKFDAIWIEKAISADFKTTIATTQSQFVSAIKHFEYDRQGAYYMDIGKTDQHWIIGISKKNHKVFKFCIRRGDEVYNQGKSRYQTLAVKWDMYNFLSLSN